MNAAKVDELVHASDTFTLWLSLTLAGAGLAGGAYAGLLTTILKPLPLIIFFTVATTATIIFGVLSIVQGWKLPGLRRALKDSEGATYSIPANSLGSVTTSGLIPITPGPQGQGNPPAV